MDNLKDISLRIGGRIRRQDHFNVNLDEKSFRRLVIKDYKRFQIQIDEYKTLYTIGIKVDSILALSINKPDKIFLFNKPFVIDNAPYKLYVSSEENLLKDESIKHFLISILGLLKAMNLSSNEGVFIYKNLILFAFHIHRNIIAVLDDIIDLINDNRQIFENKEVSEISLPKEIPEKLKPLLPFLKYSVSDDVERNQMIEQMKKSQKERIINSVTPFMDEMNEYLNTFNDKPFNEAALFIQNLAELVSELQIKTFSR